MNALHRMWILLVVLFFAVGSVSAEMTPLAEDEMAGISGGFGLAIPAGETVGLRMAIGTLYYFDEDGAAPFSQGGYLSLCGVHLNGSISTNGSPLSIDTGVFQSIVDNSMVSGMSYLIDDLTIRIDDFSIDAIRVGSAPGNGLSFGAIGMQDFVMQLSGTIQVYVH
ncbi:MAG: hypothetical protein HY911_00435 [Desulfobacterales bacterium]|nr:hypothetical protein [Desulfobacterales bacterium]